MSLQRAPAGYQREDQDRVRLEIDRREMQNRKLGKDVEIAGAERLIINAPDGSRWSIVVDNAGALSTEAVA